MICQNCGKEYDTHENTFCPQCGAGKNTECEDQPQTGIGGVEIWGGGM